MAGFFSRLIAGDHNRLVQGCGSLMGIAAGLIADRHLTDGEVHYLKRWLDQNRDMAAAWPGDVLLERISAVLADGIISEGERAHLVETLQKICGGEVETPGATGSVNQIMFDERAAIRFPKHHFCITGEFVYGPRERVHATITERGGTISKGITKKVNYLVVGLRGSDEWKHGSYGTKIIKAVEYKRLGAQLSIVREDQWSASLKN